MISSHRRLLNLIPGALLLEKEGAGLVVSIVHRVRNGWTVIDLVTLNTGSRGTSTVLTFTDLNANVEYVHCHLVLP
jgi:hypothetical protein